MIEAARRNKRVVQVGTQSRSTAHVQQAMEKLTSGVIGDVLVSKAWNSQLRKSIGHAQAQRPALDARLRPVDRARAAGPLPVEFAAGHLAMVVQLRRRRHGQRRRARHRHGLLGAGRRHASHVGRGTGRQVLLRRRPAVSRHAVRRSSSIPATAQAGHKRQLIFEQRIWSPYVQEGYENGNAFYGTKGMMLLGKRGGYKIFGPRNKLIEEVKTGEPDLPAHHQNFLGLHRQRRAAKRRHRDQSPLVGAVPFGQHRHPRRRPTGRSIRSLNKSLTIRRLPAWCGAQYRDGHWAVPPGV